MSETVWNVIHRSGPTRGDPEGFWKSDDYVIFVCREGILAEKMSLRQVIEEHAKRRNEPVFRVGRAIASLGSSHPQQQQSLTLFFDRGQAGLVRYHFNRIAKVTIRRIFLTQCQVRIELHDWSVHSYALLMGKDECDHIADAVRAAAPQINLVEEDAWLW